MPEKKDGYLAYCFLYDDARDLRCDFEIASDEISSMIGLLRSLVDHRFAPDAGELRADLSRLNELMYHINPSLRTRTAITETEVEWLHGKIMTLRGEVKDVFDKAAPPRSGGPRFVLPQGCTAASYSHIIRNKCKALVRLLSRYKQQGHEVDEILFDCINLYSGYFYFLALKLNRDQGVEETEFKSRVYS
jgi:cob(I)alamin adenosyltransferase